MKKKKNIIICVICISLICSGVIAYSKSLEIKGAKEFKEIGEGLKDAAKDISELPNLNSEQKNVIGSVMGVKISKEYFNFRYASYLSNKINYENPKAEAWNSIKKQIWEENFAKEKNIYPSDKDTTHVKNEYNATKEGKILIKSFCEGIGMEENEYWEFYKKYEAPLAVTHGKVVKFLEKNKLNMPNIDQIQSEIIDKDYYERL
jgi:hypothetical protein